MKAKKTKMMDLEKSTLAEFEANKVAFLKRKEEVIKERDALSKKFQELTKLLTEESEKYGIPYEDPDGYFTNNDRMGDAVYIPKSFVPKFGLMLESLTEDEFAEAKSGIQILRDDCDFSIPEFENFAANAWDGWISSSC